MDVAPLLAEIRAGLEQLYGPRLKGVYLYGSYARGEADPESDLDILVVLDDFEQYGREVNLTGELISDLSLKHALTISCVFLRQNEWLHGDTPFLGNAREEAIPA